MQFRLLGEERTLAGADWDPVDASRLWRYNLHYFADLTARDAAVRAQWHGALLRQWVRDNPPTSGTGWDSYPTSLRIVNWIKWDRAGNTLPPECVDSLAVQARWLSARLERHLLGNHLFVNAKALLFAGAFFEGPEAGRWLTRATQILRIELREQILPDGGHFELSPMYHALALEDVLDICNIAGTVPPDAHAGLQEIAAAARTCVGAMGAWLAALTHPDGEVAFFNDAAMDVAATAAQLQGYADRLGLAELAEARTGLTLLADSGYVRLERGGAVVIADVARIGPDYLPGHAHADSLAFEMSLHGIRLFVNSGTSLYGTDAERLRQRGTAAHNTVLVDGADSSEVWSGFRVGRRARPFDVRAADDGDVIRVEGAHDGYRRGRAGAVHRRRWMLDAGTLIVDDEITGTFRSAESRLLLHPDIEVVDAVASTDAVSLKLASGEAVRVTVEGASLATEPATWHPRFGASVPTRCLVARLTGGTLRTRVTWDDRA